MTQKTPETPSVVEDDSFDLNATPELSPETLARGTRYATDDERATLLKSIASLPIDDEAAPSQPA